MADKLDQELFSDSDSEVEPPSQYFKSKPNTPPRVAPAHSANSRKTQLRPLLSTSSENSPDETPDNAHTQQSSSLQDSTSKILKDLNSTSEDNGDDDDVIEKHSIGSDDGSPPDSPSSDLEFPTASQQSDINLGYSTSIQNKVPLDETTSAAIASSSQALFGDDVSSSSDNNCDNETMHQSLDFKKTAKSLGLGSSSPSSHDGDSVTSEPHLSSRQGTRQDVVEELVVDDIEDKFLDEIAEEHGNHSDFINNDDDNDDIYSARDTQPEACPIIASEMPKSSIKFGNDLWYVKLPNFLSIDTRPFDPNLYEDEADEDDVPDEEGRKRLKLKVENTIRWRYYTDKNGQEMRESNARIVQWDDGTSSLYLGNEIFELTELKIEDKFNHLYVIQEAGLQAQAIFQKKLIIKPCSTDSQTHRKITMSIAERVNRASKVRILPVVFDNPETRRAQLQTEEDKRSKDERIQAAKKRRQMLNLGANKLSRNYLENDGGSDEEISINAIKKKTAKVRNAARKRGRKSSMSGFIDSSNSSESDESDKNSHLSNENETIISSKDESEASSLELGVPHKRRSSNKKEEDNTNPSSKKSKQVLEETESSDEDDDNM